MAAPASVGTGPPSGVEIGVSWPEGVRKGFDRVVLMRLPWVLVVMMVLVVNDLQELGHDGAVNPSISSTMDDALIGNQGARYGDS